jgi:hypothetical protein
MRSHAVSLCPAASTPALSAFKPSRSGRTGEVSVRCAIAPPTRDRREDAKEHAPHCASCHRFGMPFESVCPRRARPNKVSIICPKRSPSVTSTRTRASPSTRIPPVVPYIRLDCWGSHLGEECSSVRRASWSVHRMGDQFEENPSHLQRIGPVTAQQDAKEKSAGEAARRSSCDFHIQ